MARVRVTCRAGRVDTPASRLYPAINVVLPDITDVEVSIVHDDGTVEPLHGVEWIRWEAKVGSEPNRLTMCFVDPAEFDIEADVELAQLVPADDGPPR